MNREAQVPGFWRLLWVIFMQPLILENYFWYADQSGLGLWRTGGAAQRSYLLRMAIVLTIASTTTTAFCFSALWALGFDMTLLKASMSIAMGVAIGIALGVVLASVTGVAAGVVTGVALAASFSIAFVSPSADIALLIVVPPLGVAAGIVWSIAGGTASGITLGIGVGVAISVVVSALAVFINIGWDTATGVAAGVAWIISYLRVPLIFGEVPIQGALFMLEKVAGIPTLRFAPVLHHDLSYFPHPYLHDHLLLAAERDPKLVHRTLDACAIAPGQRGIGRRVLAHLQARELDRAVRERKLASITELEGEWLPGRRGADPLLLGFAETARYLASAQVTSLPYHRKQKVERAREQIRRLRVQLRQNSFLARTLSAEALPAWERLTEDLLREAERAATHQIANPFQAGEPLSPEEGRETFRGREDLIHSIEALLGEPGRGCSIALLGPRRCGKTSLLKMLPLMLPDAVCVLFDLQDNPIDSPGSFFSALERRAREQVRRDRQLDLPQFPEGSPFEAGSRWIESLDEWAGDRRILLCLDEFERLESLFPGSQRELLQLLGLLRGTVQHRRRIRVLVSGAAPFDELDTLWNDHLINVLEVRISHLGESTTEGLLRKPIPDFPDDVVPEEVARTIFHRTGGQPYLVQLYGSLLISRLNSEDRRQADLKDIPRVEEDVLQQATYYFRNTYQTVPPQAKEVLLDLAFERKPELDAATRRWLRRRVLLTDEDRLSIPVFGAWLREEEAS